MIPNCSRSRTLYFDKGRAQSVLNITRRLLLLVLVFVMTSHAAQGQTFNHGAIVDLNLGGSSSAMPSCVAIARIERRCNLLIVRPVHREASAQGQQLGLQLLLNMWLR